MTRVKRLTEARTFQASGQDGADCQGQEAELILSQQSLQQPDQILSPVLITLTVRPTILVTFLFCAETP